MTTLKIPKIGFQDQLLLTAGQKYCRMLQREHSAILSNFIKLPVAIKTFVLSVFEWQFYTGFTVHLGKVWVSGTITLCMLCNTNLPCRTIHKYIIEVISENIHSICLYT